MTKMEMFDFGVGMGIPAFMAGVSLGSLLGYVPKVAMDWGSVGFLIGLALAAGTLIYRKVRSSV